MLFFPVWVMSEIARKSPLLQEWAAQIWREYTVVRRTMLVLGFLVILLGTMPWIEYEIQLDKAETEGILTTFNYLFSVLALFFWFLIWAHFKPKFIIPGYIVLALLYSAAAIFQDSLLSPLKDTAEYNLTTAFFLLGPTLLISAALAFLYRDES